MTATTEQIPQESSGGHEARELMDLGYDQELHRKVGSFASFAAGFSFVSILTTVFQLFALGFSFGGAAFFWTWPIVFGGQLLVALNFAVMSARFPISGAIFQWSSRLAGPVAGWFTGWVMVIGQVITVAVAAIALQAVLPSIWSGFQIVGGEAADPSVTSDTGAKNAVLLGIGLLVITTLVNVIGVRLMASLTSLGVTIELIGVVAIVVALFTHRERGVGVIMTRQGYTGDSASYISAFLASSLMAAYVMVGFDSAGELSEETTAPRRTTPRTILRALCLSGIGGALLIMAALMAAPSLTDGNLSKYGLAWVLTSSFGGLGGRILLCAVAVAVFACTLACQTSCSRMVFSMSREGMLPFHQFFARVSPRTGTPIPAAISVGVGAALVLLVNFNQSAIFTALSSLCIAMLYMAYLGVTGPLLICRLRRRHIGFPDQLDETGVPVFTLGRWGLGVNAAAVGYQIFMIINLMWPRTAIYDLTGNTWWLRWSAVLFVALTLLVGMAIHQRNRSKGYLGLRARSLTEARLG
ncbi:permease, urea carboxylase system [Propionibacterium cyclohexanicum]|uniref:Permease, urea carboxylase system n=1 Tax=Propionibacterium cyclohexanicum TaxID=64702 RepID=A0A1H9SGD2_9ACTN|nr:amino acid permease [Propionibacterium cyclohexanicum]SER84096.1 permease, urea carboxylase system [Propionibacterium cyclohexanicum]